MRVLKHNCAFVFIILVALALACFGLTLAEDWAVIPFQSACMFGIMAIAVFKRGRVALLSPFLLIVMTLSLTYGLRPLYLTYRDQPLTYADGYDARSLPFAMTLALIYVLFIWVGYFGRVGKYLGEKLSQLFSSPWVDDRVLPTAIGTGVVALILYIITVAVSGISFLSSFTQSFAFREVTGNEGLLYISGCALLGMWDVFYLLVVYTLTGGRSVASRLWLGVMFVVFSILTIPFGSRGYLLGPIAGLLWLMDTTRVRARLSVIKLLPVILPLALIMGAMGIAREVGNFNISGQDLFVQMLSQNGLRNVEDHIVSRFDSLDFFTWTLDTFPTQHQGFLMGRSALDFLVQPLPRVFYPDKPYKISAFLRNLQVENYDFKFTPEYGLITECYINFGVFGMIIGGGLFGVLMRLLEIFLERQGQNRSVLFWYAPLCLMPMNWTLAGFNADASVYFIMATFVSMLVLASLTWSRKAR